jgi:hypothetical protein
MLIKRTLYLRKPTGRDSHIVVRKGDDGGRRNPDSGIASMRQALSPFEHVAQPGLSTPDESGYHLPSLIDGVVVYDDDLVPDAPGILP